MLGRTAITTTVGLCCLTLVLHVYVLVLLWKQRVWKSMEILLAHAYCSNGLHSVMFSVSILLFHKSYSIYLFTASFMLLNIRLITLVHIGVHRFTILYFPLRSKLWITKTRTKRQLIATYVVVLIIFIAYFLVVALYDFKSFKEMTLMLAIECTLIVIIYASIFVKYLQTFIRRKRCLQNRNNSTRSRSRSQQSLKPMILSVFITLSFFCCNIPIFLKVFGIVKGQFLVTLVWAESIVTCLGFILTNKYTKFKTCCTIRKENGG